MAQESKVVSLRQAQGVPAELPAALIRLRDASARSLTGVMSEFFDSADDVLFGMADRAGSNQDQVAYFDAMRELRLRRKAVTSSMLNWVSRAFNEIGHFDPMPRGRSLEEVDQDSLTILDDSELEQKVAIGSLVNKLANRYADPVRLLSVRIAHVSGKRNLADRQMPLSPEVICTGLGEASGELDIDIRARLVVLKLFDRLLLDRLSTLYQEANRLLVAEGVLPDLKRPSAATPDSKPATRRPVPPSSGASTSTNMNDAEPGVGDGDSSVTFSELTRLLHRNDGGQQVSAGGRPAISAHAGGGEFDTRDLMSQLGDLQTSTMTSENGQVLPLSELLNRVLSRGSEQNLPVNQVDGDVINLVAMLFEFILDDRQLPAVMKMLIGRLQIPVLKVALLDRSFFNRGGHPARKLLNELAMAGIGWSPRGENQRDPLREKVEEVVERLLNEFTDNVDLFGELLKDFQHFMDLDRRRRELVEQRLRDAEEGRARQEMARDKITTLLDGLLETYELPEKAQIILREPWRKYLEWLFLREGEKSAAWQDASDLTMRLAWSLDPQPVEENTRGDLLKAIPVITDTLRNGLHEISWDPFAIDAVIRDLELAHVDVLQGLVTRPREEKREKELPSGPADEMVQTPERPLMKEGHVQPELSARAEPTADPKTEEPGASVGVEEVPTVTATEEHAETSEPPVGIQEAVAEAVWMEKAAGLRVGCWVEMPRDNGRLRCKLAAIIRATGKYIFVNRNGAKVAEYLQDELALALSQGQVTLLDDGLIFDRALESIIDNLRHNRRD